MKKFLSRCALFTVGLVALWGIYIAIRVFKWQKALEESMRMAPGTEVLFVGDSHIGCTFDEGVEYKNKVLWGSSLPTQISLMRLEDMERLSKLKGIKTIVIDFGLQTIGQQRNDRMVEFYWRLIPITWRHSVAELGLLHCPLKWISYPMLLPKWNIILQQSPISSNLPITERPEKEREEDFAKIRTLHFAEPTIKNGFDKDWELHLKNALIKMAELCKRNEIRLVVVSSPVTSYYRAGIPSKVESIFHDFQAFMKSNNIEYHDFRDWSDAHKGDFGRGDSDFKDCFHFTDDARSRFTAWFYKKLVMLK